ncbi:FIST signal transduction protein [Anaeromyxobacter terrae]|uniref:FIST signal transduction protein n=1 Tax=Anaeromyxobacter terrae TaxID=2925406 RepID=UPI001F574442|nr:FIST N-terminal domain-containing protein [Anaeromyxobacter sp. SG22]
MRWASAVSRQPLADDAFGEAAEALEHQLDGSTPDLLLAFTSPEHASEAEHLVDLAARRFPRALLVGCTAGGVIGDAHEVEDGPALSLTAAELPGVTLSAFRVEPGPLPADPPDWRARIGCPPVARPKLLLLADPFTVDVGGLVEGLDRAYPGAPKFGGLASGGRAPNQNRLFVAEDVHRSGGVGVVLSGNLAVDTLIAQGCRPIGTPMLVTRCKHGVLQELDGRPPLHVISELFGSLDARDRELMQSSLFLGLELRSDEVELEPGELLVRNLVGADESTGALAVGAELRPMTVAQFVLRDAHSAEQELLRMLARHRRARVERPAGALLFSCVGRGAGLFGHADHDTGLFEEQLGPAPLGGFFCNGEIGPVGGTTFLHGYTSAFAMFREAQGGEHRLAGAR